jgi:hypothetical protein
MNGLFPIDARPENFYGPGLRIHRVESDSMAPALLRRDVVIVRPVDRYMSEGICLLSDIFGGAALYRVGGCFGAGPIMLQLIGPCLPRDRTIDTGDQAANIWPTSSHRATDALGNAGGCDCGPGFRGGPASTRSTRKASSNG